MIQYIKSSRTVMTIIISLSPKLAIQDNYVTENWIMLVDFKIFTSRCLSHIKAFEFTCEVDSVRRCPHDLGLRIPQNPHCLRFYMEPIACLQTSHPLSNLQLSALS